ncbi:MAG: zf-HC2 domain-containing protein [Lachnospiraceae bacterium]|nr:zf-HC2 domain-containing protein [Lachnospiraceae bacterium]
MKNKSCDVILDLLPLYVDGICSKESRNLVEEHIGECESCKNLLENMKLDINILSKNNEFKEEANVIKKVKKKIWIERIVIALVTLFVTGIIMFSIILNLSFSNKNMNDVVDFDEIYVEEDDEGNLWLVRSGNGAMAGRIFPEVYNQNGELMISSEKIINQLKDGEEYQVRIVLYETPLIYAMQKYMNSDLSSIEEEKSMLFSKDKLDKYNEIIIEKSNGTKKTLWEKEK